jgi:ACT domain-containing protein
LALLEPLEQLLEPIQVTLVKLLALVGGQRLVVVQMEQHMPLQTRVPVNIAVGN